MIETEDYWIVDNKFIFKPNFNELIDKYFELISNYNELIFFNYTDINICIEINNLYCFKYNDNISKFNQKIKLPENLTYLTFGRDFNQKVELPLGIKYLKLENDTMHNLDYLPDGIEVLELGKYLNNDSLCNLPNSLKIIKLNKNYNGNIKCLPTNTKIEYYE